MGDCFHDQLHFSGHYERAGDLERFAALGIKALRYPVLWERWGDADDWSWLDAQLQRIQELGIRPIIGLVHHGSGPLGLSLVDPGFAPGLARFAERVARRYPWVVDYTPVNEPLTTARFSALYGHWYPHLSENSAFLDALVNQCQATAEAMRAIRSIQPLARLIQTEDLARVHSVPALDYQARFENERRWLSLDLLCGHVDPAALGRPVSDPCPPDLIGVNYYVTSERFLDLCSARYPATLHGGNGQHRYVDTEAVRAGRALGATALLLECWQRYRIPMAVTEAHLGCTREEQMRWLLDIWNSANHARQAGADVRAVTSWALLGGYDWSSLVTKPRGDYEPGAYDVRGPEPRLTGVGKLVRELAGGQAPSHPTLATAGWWKRNHTFRPHAPILLTGSAGRIGSGFVRAGASRALSMVATTRRELELSRPIPVGRMLDQHRPWAVIHAAGFSRPALAERYPLACFRDNVQAAAVLASECHRRGLPLLCFSSDQVFADGIAGESDLPRPVGLLARSLHERELAVLAAHPGALLVRTSAVFSAGDDTCFPMAVLRALRRGTEVEIPCQGNVSPTSLVDLVDACLDLLLDGASGVWHLTNQSSLPWTEWAQQVARAAGYAAVRIRPASASPWAVLVSERGPMLPSLGHALNHFMDESRQLRDAQRLNA